MATESPSKDDDFVTGDVRSQIHATLLSMHVLWLREHNRIAERLAEALKYKIDKMSPKEQDEILFQVRFVSFQKTVARVSPPNYSEPLWCGNSLESLHSQSQNNWEVFVSWQNPCTGFTGFTDWTGARVSWSANRGLMSVGMASSWPRGHGFNSCRKFFLTMHAIQMSLVHSLKIWKIGLMVVTRDQIKIDWRCA